MKVKTKLADCRVIHIHEPLFKICHFQYIDAILLERFLSGDFDKPKQFSVVQFSHDLFLEERHSCKIIPSLKRLVHWGYIIQIPPIKKRGEASQWKVDYTAIEKALDRISDAI